MLHGFNYIYNILTYYMGSWTAKLEELQAETSRGERSELKVQEAIVLPLPVQLHLLP